MSNPYDTDRMYDKQTAYEAEQDRKLANIFERLLNLEKRIERAERELKMDGEKDMG